MGIRFIFEKHLEHMGYNCIDLGQEEKRSYLVVEKLKLAHIAESSLEFDKNFELAVGNEEQELLQINSSFQTLPALKEAVSSVILAYSDWGILANLPQPIANLN